MEKFKELRRKMKAITCKVDEERKEDESMEDTQEEIEGEHLEDEGENEQQEDGGDEKNETETVSVNESPTTDESIVIPQDDVEETPSSPGVEGNSYPGSSFRRNIMDCGTCFSKYILCLFNFIILVAGAGVLFLGVWMYADKDSLLNVASVIDENALPQLDYLTEPEMSVNISYLLMAAGGSIFILSILGYCGALRESRCLLGFYGFLLVLILILEITAAGLAFVYKDTAEDEVRSLLKSTISSYYTSDSGQENAQTKFLNLVMTKMDCCGIDNYQDFYISPYFNQSGLSVPPACCIYKNINGNKTLLDPDCPKNPKPENSYYMMGCYNVIMQQIKDHMDIVIYVVIGLVGVELLSTFLAFCLCKSLEPYDK